MNDEMQELLEDILTEAHSIKTFISGHTLESYMADKKTRFAVERCFEIIGEAFTRVSKSHPELLESIRNYRSIKSFRNLIVHAYDYIDDRIVWGIIQNDLDNLIEDVRNIK
jgi:uncharacterized protein with HEPN domain